MRTCRRCLFDETVRNITFDETGLCMFCQIQEDMRRSRRKADPQALFLTIRRRMRAREYDCIVPFSGGLDSSFVLYSVKKAGLRPIAVHTDNGWVTDLAKRNMASVTSILDVPLINITTNPDVLRSAHLAFLKASVPELCLGCEVTSLSELLSFAARNRIPYLLFGYSPETDGFLPLRWHYVDGRYFDSLAERFSDRPTDVKRLNRTRAWDMVSFLLLRRIRCIQFPRYAEWDEDHIRSVLTRELSWVDGGRHSDCEFYPVLRFIQNRKFKIEKVKSSLSAGITSGRLTRDKAQTMIRPPDPEELEKAIGVVIKKLDITRPVFKDIMARSPRDFTEFPTYYPVLKKLKPLIGLGCRLGFFTAGYYEYLYKTGGI